MKIKKYIVILVSSLLIEFIFTFNAQAAVKSYIINDSGKCISFDAEDLIEDYTNSLIGISSPMYDKYLSELSTQPGLIAFGDHVKGYVSAEAVENAYANALAIGDKDFSIDNFTESVDSSDVLDDVNVGYEWKNGEIIAVDGSGEDTSNDFDVISIY